jgi:hypothetical protein
VEKYKLAFAVDAENAIVQSTVGKFEAAEEIWNNYLVAGADFEVNISDAKKKVLARRIEQGAQGEQETLLTLFDEAHMEVAKLIVYSFLLLLQPGLCRSRAPSAPKGSLV